MKANQVFPSIGLKAADLNGKPMVLTVSDVKSVQFGEDPSKRALTFEESEKELVLNKTNWNAIAKIAGADDDEMWSGTEIELFPTMVEYRGDMVDAIRIRPVGGWDVFKPGKKTKKDETPSDLPF